MQELVLIRGLPGSGKTTLAKKEYPDHTLVEADIWRMTKNGYAYDADDNKRAHDWCFLEAERQLRLGRDIVVTGIYVTRIGVMGYKTLAAKYNAAFVVREVKGKHKSEHGVPKSEMERMKRMWDTWEEV